ncbi:MAG: site-specific integrase [Thermodesulfobacteriota bacterium]
MARKQRARGMGSIFKHGNSWWIAYYNNKRQIKERIGHVGIFTRGQAEQALKARMGEVVQGRYKLQRTEKNIPLKNLIDKYLNWITENQKGYKREAHVTRKFFEFVGNTNISQITSWQIEKYKSLRKQEGVKPSTINRELNVLRSMFNRAIGWGESSNNPISDVKKVKPLNAEEYERKSKYIPHDALDKITDNAPIMLKAFILVARNTGMRVSELIKLKWTDIDLETGHMIIRDAKNYNQRTVPMNSTAHEVICGLNKDKERVFNYCSKDSVGKAWRRVLDKVELEDYRPHDLRHSFITDLVTKGVDIITVMEITGHKDIRMLKHYTHPSQEHKKNAVKMLEPNFNNHNTITLYKPTINIANS